MSQTAADSSPLSSPPASLSESTSPVGSSTPAQMSSPSSHRTNSRQPKLHPTAIATAHFQIADQSQTALQLQLDSPAISNTGKKCAPKPAAKRAHDDKDEGGGSPPKRPANQKTLNAKHVTKTRYAEKAAAKKAASAKVAFQKASAKKPPPNKAAPKKDAPPPPTPSNRPSRNRRVPERFEDIEEKPILKALPPKKGPRKVFDPIFITTNSTSRLGKADVYHMLLEGPAWTRLSAEQQNTLISMLPQDSNNESLLDKTKGGGTEDTRPQAFTVSNDCFRTDVAKFREDLKNGHLAKTWQAAAEQAVIERAAGDYDDWKAEEAELWWGQKSK